MGLEDKIRWQSAAIMLGVIFIIGVLNIKFLTWLFFGVLAFFAIEEAKKLFKIESENDLIVVAVSWVAAYLFYEPILLIFLILLVMAAKLAYDKSIEPKAFLPIIYPYASILFMWSLYLNDGVKVLIWLLIIVALSDVGAYYSGKKFGKTKFSETSPNKTLEGVFGGVALSTIVGAILISTTSDINFFVAILVTLLTSVASIFGDLFESYLKREAGVKDSGDLIPGHGGILDRIDGYLFASVMLYILLNLE